MIVFGWNSLKVRRFTLADIGIIRQAEPDIEFEVRQAYFHLFWIPFFGLGKRWVVRRGGKLYEMPGDIKYLAQKSLTGIKTPWYTFTGPLLLLAAGIVFSAVTSYESHQSHKRFVSDYKERTDALTAKLQHLTTNDFIALDKLDPPYESGTYLKVEDIKGDVIMVTAVESEKDAPMEVEYEYTKHANTLPSMKVSHKQLLNAFPKEYDSLSINGSHPYSATLLNDGKRYIVKDVVRHFKPIVKVSYAYFNNFGISIRCDNEGWPATIIEMKNLVGDIDWSETINTEFPNERNYSGTYTLEGKNVKYFQPYKFVMTLKDSTGHLHKYEFEGPGTNSVTMHEL
jgi:hypothetical protein